MCAINGIIDFNKTYSEWELRKAITDMNSQVVYRGPDDEGIVIVGNVGIGMRRLSIIDLDRGHQPIFNEKQTVAVVCNGEIYNYRSLRIELEQEGHTFRTNSDTEVIVHAYEKYGVDCFNRFDGMFAIAIYDFISKTLLLARDKAGEKPLYWYKNEKVFMFASELKSIMKTGWVSKEISSKGLHQYFTLTYIPAPLTIFQNVYKLPAASFMTITSDGVEKQGSYWDMKFSDEFLIEDYDSCKKMLRETLWNAVESRMVSDVPLGSFMSGGIDSTIITGIASQISDKPLDTFTIGFEHRDFDERDRAEIAARAFGTKNHIEILTFKKANSLINKIINSMDEPFADSSTLPTYFVSKLASNYVKVVLTGDGGDELFAGYSKYLIDYYSKKYKAIPSFLTRGVFEPLIRVLPADNELHNKIAKVIANAREPIYEQRLHLMQNGCYEDKYKKLVQPDYYVVDDSVAPVYEKYEGVTDELSQTLYTDFKVVLEGDMFAKVDRMSMLHSIETRSPMVAGGVLELAPRIPSRFKISRSQQKIILKDTFDDILPKELVNKTKKGFSSPLEHWFRGEMKDELQFQLNQTNIPQEILNFSFVQQTLQEHISKKKNHEPFLWALYVFVRWFNKINRDISI